MDLPTHITSELGVSSPISEDDLAIAADNWPIAQSVFGLSGREFVEAIAEAQSKTIVYSKSQPTRLNLGSWKYIELRKDGLLEGLAFTIPMNGSGLPPTQLAQALVQAWFDDATLLTNGNVPSGLLIRGVAVGATLGNFIERFSTEWTDSCFLLEGASHQPSWVTKSGIDISGTARLIGTVRVNYKHLFVEAISEFKIKWRFLSLYRILEHGYLVEIFQTLEATFFQSPKESLAAASKSAENEIQQFITLADRASLQNQFETFHDEFENLKAGGNQLANAIERSISQSKQQNQANGKWQMGVLYCYKLRCSIVHAGLTAPIYDSYPDGPALLSACVPILESTALSFVGMRIS